MADLTGRTLGRYRVLDHLGEDTMGVVYRGRDPQERRDVLLRILPRGAVMDDAARQRFRAEALALSRIGHPGIALIHDCDQKDGLDFLITERVIGTPLTERIAEGPLPQPDALRVGVQVAEALEAAHGHGVTHRDLTPSNVVLASGRARVLDFGLARLRQEALASLTARSRASATIGLGTLAYLAPEQLTGQTVDERTDLYALGVILYEMVTGRCPFASDLQTAMVYEITNQPPTPPGRHCADLSGRLEEVILRLLQKHPRERHPSASALVADLRELS